MERRRLGEALRALRAERGLSQEEAAERAGVHAKHLQRIEGGNANVTLATLVALARAYRVAPVKLFAEEPLPLAADSSPPYASGPDAPVPARPTPKRRRS